MEDVVSVLHQAGFTPTQNTDEDYPALEGEYAVSVKTLRPWVNEDTSEKEAYMLQLRIGTTLSGETGEGRLLTRFYRIAGAGFDGADLTPQQVQDNLKRLCNDLFTLGIELDRTNTTAFEESFARAIDAPGYARSWKAKNRNHPDGPMVQQFRIKQAKDLRKAKQETHSNRSEHTPF